MVCVGIAGINDKRTFAEHNGTTCWTRSCRESELECQTEGMLINPLHLRPHQLPHVFILQLSYDDEINAVSGVEYGRVKISVTQLRYNVCLYEVSS